MNIKSESGVRGAEKEQMEARLMQSKKPGQNVQGTIKGNGIKHKIFAKRKVLSQQLHRKQQHETFINIVNFQKPSGRGPPGLTPQPTAQVLLHPLLGSCP